MLAYTTATATPDLSHICDLHHSSWQYQVLDPPSEARDRTCDSWFLVGFVSAAPQWEPLEISFRSIVVKVGAKDQKAALAVWGQTIFPEPLVSGMSGPGSACLGGRN